MPRRSRRSSSNGLLNRKRCCPGNKRPNKSCGRRSNPVINFNQQRIQGSSAQMNYENLCCFLTESPKFSVKPGKYNEPRTVKITNSTAGATIYDTTDGWTPTAESQRYTGPIKVSSTTKLRAIAISPRTGSSFVTTGKYTIDPPGTAPNSHAAAAARSAGAHATTPEKLSSRKAQRCILSSLPL